jgi:hypothetical protein
VQAEGNADEILGGARQAGAAHLPNPVPGPPPPGLA